MMDKIVKHKLHKPNHNEVAEVLQAGLSNTFSHISVDVVDCPDLKGKPYMLAAEGICGNPCLADVGGVPYLIPVARTDKVYNLREIAKKLELPNALIIGAGAGPRHHVGTNCEMMPNIKFNEDEFNNTHVAKIGKDGNCELVHLKDNEEFCLLGNLFASEGKSGKVIKVTAQHRKTSENFVSAMRKTLAEHYKDQPIGIGGVFNIQVGEAKLHIMPDYSKTPLKTDEDVNNWLKFYNQPAPLVCLSTFISHDPGLDLRVEHTHCFSDHDVGGHYHEDTTPDIVKYEGYFNVADFIYRIDPPAETHQVGRD
ncbi:ester hydrolase C11orf54 homolog isoform X2 [Stegodyphus dumicola]|uniref:ester hydrolase C11orf54 homolog isoform X2 n=1 Tax=Stegodyphus dumicola TaxID=202533 RepID=UPI0015B3361F|nr:ester hydrolase C11orf54 homolog isoform X2 [Stegodyphus dumicola]